MNFTAAPNAGFEVATATPTTLGLPQGSTHKTFSLREVWAAVYRSRFWIAGIMAITIAAAIAYSLLTTKLYEGNVSLEIRQEAEKVLGTEADREGGASKGDTDRFLQTQLDILRSRATANAVAESLGLYRGNAFLEAMNVEPAEGGTMMQSPEEVHRDQVQSALIGNLDVEYFGNTRVADLTFTSPNPRLSMQVANAYADNFIRGNLERKFDSSRYALNFLQGQLREAQDRLSQSEREALAYARRTRIVDASNAAGGTTGGSGQSLVTAQLVNLNQAYSAAMAKRIAAEEKWQTAQRLPLLKLPEVLQNAAVQTLIGQRAQLNAKYRQDLANRFPDHPTVRETQEQLGELNRQTTAVAQNVRDSIRSDYQIALAEERKVLAELDSLKSDTLEEQDRGIRLSILRRQADTDRGQYESLLRRFNALNAEAGVQTNNISIVDRAQINEAPAWPKLPVILALALVLGGALSGLFVVVREQLFDAVRLPDDVVERLGLPLLGSVPDAGNVIEEIKRPKSPVSEALGSIRTALSLLEGGVPRSLMVTSTQASEGKSSTCYGIAASFSRLNKRVLIIDADLRRPNAHRLFNAANDVGVSAIVSGQSTVEEARKATDLPGVDLLVAGEVPPNPSELINSRQFTQLISDQMEHYDLVLVDSAPVLGIADAVILTAQMDATLFIIEAGRNTVRGANFALGRLRRGGGAVVGAVLTKYHPGRLGYGYGEDYGYGYSYK